MGKEIERIDTGLIHPAFIKSGILVISANPFGEITTSDPDVIRGHVAVENNQIVNEDGMEFGIELKKVLKRVFRKIKVV